MVTGLSPGGYSRALGTSYAGKAPATPSGKALGIYSRLHMAGHSRAWDADSYAGKGTAVTVDVATFIPSIARRGRRGR